MVRPSSLTDAATKIDSTCTLPAWERTRSAANWDRPGATLATLPYMPDLRGSCREAALSATVDGHIDQPLQFKNEFRPRSRYVWWTFLNSIQFSTRQPHLCTLKRACARRRFSIPDRVSGKNIIRVYPWAMEMNNVEVLDQPSALPDQVHATSSAKRTLARLLHSNQLSRLNTLSPSGDSLSLSEKAKAIAPDHPDWPLIIQRGSSWTTMSWSLVAQWNARQSERAPALRSNSDGYTWHRTQHERIHDPGRPTLHCRIEGCNATYTQVGDHPRGPGSIRRPLRLDAQSHGG